MPNSTFNEAVGGGIWVELWAVLDYHKKRWTPEHALNRLFGEHFPGKPNLPYLSPTTAALRREQWSTEQVDTTVRPDRSTTGPSKLDVPIVVVAWNGKAYLVDGRRRVNHWVATRSAETHTVFVVQPR